MVTASTIATYGSFVSLPYDNLSMWDAIKMALPYAWINWIFLTIAISIGKEHELVTPLQMKFSLIIINFCLVLLFTKYYLHKDVSLSDIIGFIIVVLAYFVGLFHLASKYIFGIDISHKMDANNGSTGSMEEPKHNLEKEKEENTK